MFGRNNQPNTVPLAIDFHTLGTVDFCFIDSRNQIKVLNPDLKLYFAGSLKMNKGSDQLLFLSRIYTIQNNIITFTVDTYTQPFVEQITKKNTEINIEIGIETESAQQVLLRDVAYANPRVYVAGLTPPQIEPNNYYTKTEVDDMLEETEAKIPINTSDLFNDSNFVDNNSLEDALELYVKKTELVFRD